MADKFVRLGYVRPGTCLIPSVLNSNTTLLPGSNCTISGYAIFIIVNEKLFKIMLIYICAIDSLKGASRSYLYILIVCCNVKVAVVHYVHMLSIFVNQNEHWWH